MTKIYVDVIGMTYSLFNPITKTAHGVCIKKVYLDNVHMFNSLVEHFLFTWALVFSFGKSKHKYSSHLQIVQNLSGTNKNIVYDHFFVK
jgi:hypothetical protein